MLNKNDLALIRDVMEEELKPVVFDLVKLNDRMEKVEEKLDFTYNASLSLLEDSQQIFEAVVKNNLVKRVERLEKRSSVI